MFKLVVWWAQCLITRVFRPFKTLIIVVAFQPMTLMYHSSCLKTIIVAF